MTTIRQPAVADMFYPADPNTLQTMIDGFLADANVEGPVPKALIVPHAGYIYSGPVAASAYHLLEPARQKIKRVVLLGPAHRVPVLGLAATSADYFATPLGNVPIDREAVDQALQLAQVREVDPAHAMEHSLEVHLPFLQTVLADFKLVPFVVGDANPQEVAEVLDLLWGGDETLIVISSDLSHYQSYDKARVLDQATSENIEKLRPEAIRHSDACGRNPINGLLALAKQKGLTAKTIDLRNSGDTAGPHDEVVGYGAYIFVEPTRH